MDLMSWTLFQVYFKFLISNKINFILNLEINIDHLKEMNINSA